MISSRDIANLVIAHIKKNPCVTKKEICFALRMTADQFQGATPYIKTECERVGGEWCVKKEDIHHA